jgi:nitrogen fixation protein NifZ
MMIDAPTARFDWGHGVIAATDLINDGSYPDMATDALLAAAGDAGTVVQTGLHEESRTVIYMVEFASGRVVGCFDHELAPMPGSRFPAP